jgi:hypothetical protein
MHQHVRELEGRLPGVRAAVPEEAAHHARARQLHMTVVRIWAIRESAGDLCPCPAQRHRAIL